MGWWSNLRKKEKPKEKEVVPDEKMKKAKTDVKQLQERILALLSELQEIKKYCNTAYTQCTVQMERSNARMEVRNNLKALSDSKGPLPAAQKLPDKPAPGVVVSHLQQRIRDLLQEKHFWSSQKGKYKNIKHELGILGPEETVQETPSTDEKKGGKEEIDPDDDILDLLCLNTQTKEKKVEPAKPKAPPPTSPGTKTLDDLLLDI
eukprot:TRINITY_DN5500_c0_g1_i2.p1 TRINITY_DN5500_c0_g1~~TRINITY_DN5500_c0_g1_i2.p1  ORF type:complete len:205 (+),score=40.83 TRINITY_DN5500_c0_g1_i2:348-962(+)